MSDEVVAKVKVVYTLQFETIVDIYADHSCPSIDGMMKSAKEVAEERLKEHDWDDARKMIKDVRAFVIPK